MAPGQIFDMARVGLCTVVHTLQLRADVENRCATTLCLIALALFTCSSLITAVIPGFVFLFFWLQVAFLASWWDFMSMPPPCFPAFGCEHLLLSQFYTFYLVHLHFLYLCNLNL